MVLQGGVIEQAGSPLELYHHPENLFVAGFIGSPKMNFLETTVTAADGGGVTVAVPGGSSTVTVPVQPGSARTGDTVTLGIRPEHLKPGDQGQLQGEVLVAERLGGETFLYVQVAPELMIVVQADGEIPTRVHDRIAVQINPEHTHLFDRQGKAIERARRHPLADMRRPTARKAS